MPSPQALLTRGDRKAQRASPRTTIVLPITTKAKAIRLAESHRMSVSGLIAWLIERAREPVAQVAPKRMALDKSVRTRAVRRLAKKEPTP